jgi:hypothetical protein
MSLYKAVPYSLNYPMRNAFASPVNPILARHTRSLCEGVVMIDDSLEFLCDLLGSLLLADLLDLVRYAE